MKVFSHRGFHQTLPENTLAAFEAAIALGVHGIETDIRITCDGKPILYHDPQIPDGTNISALTQVEISHRLGYSVPSLMEAIALTRHLDEDFCWNLELKTQDSCAIALEVVNALKPNTAIAFTSFWHTEIVAMIQSQTDCFGYGVLWASHPFGFELPQWFESYPQIISLVFNQERLSQELVRHCHHKGRQVWAYSDRTSIDRRKLEDWGVDIVISDRPDLYQSQRFESQA